MTRSFENKPEPVGPEPIGPSSDQTTTDDSNSAPEQKESANKSINKSESGKNIGNNAETPTASKPDTKNPEPSTTPQKIPASIQTELQAKIQLAKYREALKLTPDKTRKDGMKQFFEWLLRQHERKDPHQIFAEPVTDQIAPRYSLVIKQPISFYDIKIKINKHQYENLKQIKSDFILCFENCNTYNTPDTIFYQTGKRMLSFTRKLTSSDKMVLLYNQLPFLQKIQKRTAYALLDISMERASLPVTPKPEELEELLKPHVEEIESEDSSEESFNSEVELEALMSDNADSAVDDRNGEKINSEKLVKKVVEKGGGIQSSTDSPLEVKNKAIEAAKRARERLAKVRPNDKMSYIYRQKDGSVRLNVLVGAKRKNESVQTVGDLVGKINPGCGRPTLQMVLF